MRILLVNHYAGHPRLGMEYRPFYLAREWQNQGHEVEIVACSESHVRQKKPTLKGWKTHQTIDDVSYTWLKSFRYNGNGVGRLFNMGLFVLRLWIYGRFFVKKPFDVVIASSTYPLDVYPCHNLARRWNAKFVFEVHDLWPLSPIELGGISPKHPLMKLFQHAEDYGYEHCDSLVSMLPCTLEHMLDHGLKKDKFHHVPNGVVKEDWENRENLPELHQKAINDLKAKNSFLVAYAGAHGEANDLESLLNAAELLKEGTHIVLVGQGPEKRRLIDHAKKLNLKNVTFLPAIQKHQIPTFLEQMNALYIGLAPQPLFRFGVSPNKLMDYMMAGKPIVYAIESGNHPVIEYGCGLETPPGNPKKLAQAIENIKSLKPEERVDMGRKGQQAVNQYFDYSKLAEKFLTILEN